MLILPQCHCTAAFFVGGIPCFLLFYRRLAYFVMNMRNAWPDSEQMELGSGL